MFNFLNDKKPNSQEDKNHCVNPFSDWERDFKSKNTIIDSPLIKQMGNIYPEESRLPREVDNNVRNLVIGIGRCGWEILSLFIDNGFLEIRNTICALIINQQKLDLANVSQEGKIKSCKVINLHTNQVIHGVERNFSKRGYHQVCFNQAQSYQEINTFLNRSIHPSQRVRVFVVGSLQEATVGFAGNLFRLLKRYKKDNGILTVVGIFSTTAPGGTHLIGDGEMLAALRELARFSIHETQVMEPAVGRRIGTAEGKLFDHLFLTDEHSFNQESDSRQSFQQEVGAAIAEALRMLTLPDNRKFWEHFSNILSSSTASAGRVSDAVVHTLGLRTIYYPAVDLGRFFAQRIQKDTLEALVGDDKQPVQGTSTSFPAGLYRKWMSEEPFFHPFFNWLMEQNALQSIQHLPPREKIPPDLPQVYSIKLAYHYNQFFHQGNSLKQGLYLSKWAANYFSGLRETMINNPHFEKPEGVVILDLVDQLQRITEQFSSQIVSWLNTIENDINQVTENVPESSSDLSFEDAFIRLRAMANSSNIDRSSNKGHTESFQRGDLRGDSNFGSMPLLDQVNGKIKEITEEISELASNPIRRSVLQIDTSSDLEDRYQEAIAEMTAAQDSPAAHLSSILNRVGWQFEMNESNSKVQLKAICLPLQAENNEKREQLLYPAADVESYQRSFQKESEREVKNLITSNSVSNFINQQIPFLKSTQNPFLPYDHNQAARLRVNHSGIENRSGYVLSENKILAEQYSQQIFENLSPNNIETITSHQENWFSALLIVCNIPLRLLDLFRTLYREYRFTPDVHLYPQERNAKEYEKRIRESSWEGEDYQLSPQTAAYLADKELFQLTVEAYLFDLLRSERVERDFGGRESWCVSAVGEFDRISLKTDELPDAFLVFILRRPHRKRERSDPDHPQQREAYYQALKREILRRKGIKKYQKHKDKILETWLPEAESSEDKLMKDLAKLISVEMDVY